MITMTMTHKKSFSRVTMKKKSGCQLEKIPCTRADLRLERDWNRKTTFAAKARTANATKAMTVGPKMLPLGPVYPSTHLERNTFFTSKCKHEQQVVAIAETANTQSIAGMESGIKFDNFVS